MAKNIFITGATSGFGRAIAYKFAQNDYNIVLLGRRKERLDEISADLSAKFGVQTHKICADIRDKTVIFDAVKNLPNELKNIDILVNNAGLALGQERVQDANLDDFETMIDTNIKGLIYTTKALLPSLIATRGYIFNLGSVAGNWPYPGGNVYGGTKAFVRQFSLNLRNDLARTGVRVSNIEPGLCKTEFSIVRFRGDVARADAVYDGTEFISAENIAQIIFSLANLPSNVNVNALEVMASTQTWAGFAFERE